MIADRPAGEQLSHLKNLRQLERLVIDGIVYSETTVDDLFENLSDLKQLKSLQLYSYCETPLDRSFISLATALKDLQELRLRVNAITITTIEALSYFSGLKYLDFGIWKPFETGCLTLSLSPLQFCPQLQVTDEFSFFNLSCLYLGTGAQTVQLVSDRHAVGKTCTQFCPNLRRIHLNNMFDMSDQSLQWLSLCPQLRKIRVTGLTNIASDVTENGLINLLDTSSSLEIIEIPIVFDVSDDLFSSFIRFGKRYPNNCLKFVCGQKAFTFQDKCSKSGHKFTIVSKI